LRTYPLLQRPEELLALVGPEDALVLQEMLDDRLPHGLLLHSYLVDLGLDGRSVQRISSDRVNETNVQIDYLVPDAVDAADEPVPTGHHASSLITVQAHFLVRKRRASAEDLIGIDPMNATLRPTEKMMPSVRMELFIVLFPGKQK
jgi:hypothetical protein